MQIKKNRLLILISTIIMMAALLIIAAGCIDGSQNNTTPVYSGLTVSGELQDSWERTSIPKVESMLGQKLPEPTYLPIGYEIEEVYYHLEPNSSPQVTEILLLISDQKVEWIGKQYRCRLALEIGWNEAGLGLKMPWAEYVEAIRGRLEEKDNKYVLWWESYGSKNSLGSTLRLYANREFSKDELVKIAASTPTNSSP